MSEPLIRYQNVSIRQQDVEILNDVNLELNQGEFVYLIGKVGSGKTSLLKTIYKELDIYSGEAEVMGYDLRSIKQKNIPVTSVYETCRVFCLDAPPVSWGFP